uniref:Farnesyl pyrophosphate synthase n=2 Tax=Ceratitis capitata TaxID=7213 RepID=W8B5K5_CERCA
MIPVLRKISALSTRHTSTVQQRTKRGQRSLLASAVSGNKKYFYVLGRSSSTFATADCTPTLDIPPVLKLKADTQSYLATYKDVLNDLTTISKHYDGHVPTELCTKLLEYNMPADGRVYGIITVLTYKSLIQREQLTAQNLKMAENLGWCIEMLHSTIKLAEEVEYQSTTRPGRQSWNKIQGNGGGTINNILMLESGIFELLRKHFSHLDNYVDLLELFQSAIFKATVGQSMNLLHTKQSVDTFNATLYNTIVSDKINSHLLYLPVASALHLAGVKNPKTFDQSKNLLLKISTLCQAHNDYLNCFGDPDETGEIGSDIKNNLCTWFAVKCLELANPEQRAIMLECYGKEDPEKVARVRQLYDDMDLLKKFAMYENQAYNEVIALIGQTSNEIPHDVFYTILEHCYKKAFNTIECLKNTESREWKVSQEDVRNYTNLYPEVIHELTEAAKQYKSKEAAEWYKKALEYTMSVGSTRNGLMVVSVYKDSVKDVQLTEENLRLAYLLGWCLELLHVTILLTDDMVDNSHKRRGQPCWFRVDGVGLNAINDAFMAENGVFVLLKKHFRHLDCYMDLVELFHENCFNSMCGQNMDMIFETKHVSTFNMESYDSLVLIKTSCHLFYLPIHLGLRLAGVEDKQVYDECAAITFDMGHYSQVKNDFLDCFGNPAVLGKVGIDIQTNKYSWLAVKCMQLADPQQKAIMEECYGKNDPQKVARVKKLYEELNLPSIYNKYEEEMVRKIKKHIQQAPDGVPRLALLEILKKNCNVDFI